MNRAFKNRVAFWSVLCSFVAWGCSFVAWGSVTLRDGVVAVVNEQILTDQDFAGRLALMTRQYAQLPARAEVLRQQVLNELVDNEIKRQYAAAKGHSSTPSEIEAALNRLARVNGMTAADLLGLTAGLETELKKKVAVQVMWEKVVQQELRPKVEVGRGEIDQIIRDIVAGDVVSEREISQILVGIDVADGAKVIAAAQANLAAGEDFATVAQRVNKGVSAAQGGYLGWFDEGALNSALETALLDVPTGEVAGPIQTEAGWHLVKIHRLKKVPAVNFEPIEWVHLYTLRAAGEDGSVSGLKKALGRATFLGELKQLPGVELTDKAWVEVSKLPPATLAALPAQLGLGKITRQDDAAVAFYVANRKREMSADLVAMRARVEERLRVNKLNMLERQFVRQLKQRAFVNIVTAP